MKIASKLVRPEYIYRPGQLIRRLAYTLALSRNSSSAKTPWGIPICFDPHELHGRSMLTLGLADLRVSEIISRVVRPGDMAVDVGANIGIMTSLMAARAGLAGRVFSFEPHPATYIFLEKNIASIRNIIGASTVKIHMKALSDVSSSGFICEPPGFSANSGIACITKSPLNDSIGHQVSLSKFDDIFNDFKRIRLVKIDVEGHEDNVLQGMHKSLASGVIDFVICEEFRPLPSPASNYLVDCGYEVFQIDRSFWDVTLMPIALNPSPIEGEPTSILAVHPRNSLQDIHCRGWSCLASH
jgi:FkbM family methyltransferase